MIIVTLTVRLLRFVLALQVWAVCFKGALHRDLSELGLGSTDDGPIQGLN